MKQKIYILGLITLLVVLTGLILKVNHWPAAGIMISAGMIIFVLVFLPLAMLNHYKAEGSRINLPLYIVTYITVLLVFTSMLFKIMHWPGAGILLFVTLPLPYVIFLPVYLIVTSKIRNFNIFNTVFILMLLVFISVFSALLALSVSKNRIDGSYNLSKNYNNVEVLIAGLPGGNSYHELNRKIDETLQILNDYQEAILNSERLTREKWESDAGSLVRPDSRGRAVQILLKAGDASGGARLDKSLESVVAEMEKIPACKELAAAAPLIFNLEELSEIEEGKPSRLFAEDSLAWVLIFLDGLETNLKLIRATLNQEALL
ncbi:MAG: hypothetical protein RBR81_12505 [Bacteroidales bacterium]|jgi:hypothetical protein|nr:hypothetical protein [Bacteroidales bacterium]